MHASGQESRRRRRRQRRHGRRARSKRLGADVYIVYRRGMEELPARAKRSSTPEEEGIVFKTLNNPVKINGDEKGYVTSMTCVEMELGEPDASGRRRPIPKRSAANTICRSTAVIMSLGTTPTRSSRTPPRVLRSTARAASSSTRPVSTSHQSVYAGGDAVTGAATVILAMGAGKLGAKSIDEALSK